MRRAIVVCILMFAMISGVAGAQGLSQDDGPECCLVPTPAVYPNSGVYRVETLKGPNLRVQLLHERAGYDLDYLQSLSPREIEALIDAERDRLFGPRTPVPSYRPPWGVPEDEVLRKGVEFLRQRYNPQLGLLQESPEIGKHNYYLNDAALAAYVLDQLGETELAAQLRQTLERYGYLGNGFFELAWGVPIRWPPYHHEDVVVAQIGEDRVLLQTHPGPGYFYDWSAYSNLAFMAAVNERALGNHEAARRLYEIEMSTFDGLGWKDLAYWKRNGTFMSHWGWRGVYMLARWWGLR
ncbi:MAG: hypothetical protein Kow0047_23460 [Anaerolineae bacterium]